MKRHRLSLLIGGLTCLLIAGFVFGWCLEPTLESWLIPQQHYTPPNPQLQLADGVLDESEQERDANLGLRRSIVERDVPPPPLPSR
jgi:hypothetical protein